MIDLSAAFALDAYTVKFDRCPGDSAEVRCTIWAFGPSSAGVGRSTIPYTSDPGDSAEVTFGQALAMLQGARAPADDYDDLEDLLS